MRTRRLPSSLLPIGVLVVILGILAVLQYRWTGALSEGEEARMRRSLSESMRLFTGDFDGSLNTVFSHFGSELFSLDNDEDRIGRRLDTDWTDTGLRPLVRDLWIIRVGTEEDGDSAIERYSAEANE